MTIACLKSGGMSPDSHILLKKCNRMFIAFGGRCLNIGYWMESAPGAEFLFCLIFFSNSSSVIGVLYGSLPSLVCFFSKKMWVFFTVISFEFSKLFSIVIVATVVL